MKPIDILQEDEDGICPYCQALLYTVILFKCRHPLNKGLVHTDEYCTLEDWNRCELNNKEVT